MSFFDRILPNPRDFQVMEGADFYRKNNCDVVIAVGGGSVIDAAKGIGIVAANGGYILDFEGIDQIPAAHSSPDMYSLNLRQFCGCQSVCHY